MFKNGKVLFGSVLVCGALLVGCSNDSDVKPVDSDVKVVEEEQKQEQPTEQEATGSIEEVEEDLVLENGVRDGGLLYEDLETTKIKLVEVNENEVKMQYNDTILDYMVDVNKETNGESIDYEITSQLLMTALCSQGEPEKAFTLVDKEEVVIYSYLNGEPIANGLEGLQ